MLMALALIIFTGFALAGLARRSGLPPLVGMMVAGILLGPSVAGVFPQALLAISPDIRQMALTVVLLRAGLSLDLPTLKRMGGPSLRMSLFPATAEMLTVTLLAPPLLGITRLEGALLGAVLAAVSPAVIVPEMLSLMEQGYGEEKGIPQLILAGASMDDVYVIVIFSALLDVQQGAAFSAWTLLSAPVAILLGIGGGVVAGGLFSALFKRAERPGAREVTLLLATSFFLVALETWLAPVPFSGLIGVMALGATLRKRQPAQADSYAVSYEDIWTLAELMLFVLVGAAVNVEYVGAVGLSALVLLAGGLVFRMGGVLLALTGTDLTAKERLFSMIAYLPKATVQAAIGGVPLAAGVPGGEIILAVAVLSILITAPLGALGIRRTHAALLQQAPAKKRKSTAAGRTPASLHSTQE